MAVKLTEKQSKFCEEYVKNGFNGSAAYRVAYKQKRSNVCASEAYKMLKDPRIQEEINNIELTFALIGKMDGLNKKTIVHILKEMMGATKVIFDKTGTQYTVPDWVARNNAITTFAKLSGEFTEKKKIIIEDNSDITDVDPTSLSDEERAALKEKIMKEL